MAACSSVMRFTARSACRCTNSQSLSPRLLSRNATRFGLQSTAAPLPLPAFQISAVTTKAALMDAGVAWLFGMLGDVKAGYREI